MGALVDLVEDDNEHDVIRAPGVRVRPNLQKLGTTISFAAGAIAFCGYTFALVAGDMADGSAAQFSWLEFALVVLPFVGALCSLSQSAAVRKACTPVIIATAAELMLIAGRFLRDSTSATITMTVVAVLLFGGGLGLVAHLGTGPAQDREVQLYLALLAAWTVFAGSLAMFIFGHTAILTPLVFSAFGVVVLHIHNDDPTAVRRLARRQTTTDLGSGAQRIG